MVIKRTQNAIKGTAWGIVNRVVCTIFPFVIRTIIIRVFGTEYLGLNSLFTSILHVLNITELGLSSAIVYHMYKPVSEDNYYEINAYLNMYRKLYLIIGTIVTVLGLLCLPFLPSLISGSYPSEINIYFLYILFLINTSISYFFFGYKESILFAYQRNDLINITRLISFLCLYISQIFVLIVVKNYYIYVFLMIVFTLMRGLLSSIVVKRLFPNIAPVGDVTVQQKKDVKNVVEGAALAKICAATRGSCDDIVISIFLGLTALAIFDNYYYIMAAIISILIIIETSLSGGVGNSIVKKSVFDNFEDYKKINFLYMWIVGWCSVTLACLYQPFMRLWVGNDLVSDSTTMFLFCGYFFASGMSSIPSVYSGACGLWKKTKTKSICEVAINLVLNILLINFFGLNGILVGTIISLIFVAFLWGTIILKKNYFSTIRTRDLIIPQFFYLVCTIAVTFVTYILCVSINVDNIIVMLLLRFIVCVIVPNILFALLYCRIEVFKDGLNLIKRVFK